MPRSRYPEVFIFGNRDIYASSFKKIFGLTFICYTRSDSLDERCEPGVLEYFQLYISHLPI
jgi:hypothetical protein